jgi:hypothetical protein
MILEGSIWEFEEGVKRFTIATITIIIIITLNILLIIIIII